MIRRIIAIAMVTMLGSAWAESPTIKGHTFINPITDGRVDLSACAVQNALIAILDGSDLGDVLCWGVLKSDSEKEIYIYKAANQKTYKYYLQTETIQNASAGDQAGGYREASVRVILLNNDLTQSKPQRRSTLNFRTEWSYSEGSTFVSGRLPGSRKEFSAPLYYLETIDKELNDLASEIGR